MPFAASAFSSPGAYAHSGNQMPVGSMSVRRRDGRRIEKREITVGRGRGEDLDLSGLGEIGERADEVATEPRSVRLAQTTVRADIELGELGMRAIARIGEAPMVFLGADDLIVDVLQGANVDVVVGELLNQDRREPDDDAIGHARVSEIVKEDKERKVCPEDRLVYPFLTVGPSARAAGVRKVRMERQNERAHSRILWQRRRGGCGPSAFASLCTDRFTIARQSSSRPAAVAQPLQPSL